jgi:hydrogenase maturation protease
MEPIVVIGLGNPLLGDEGIGNRLVAELASLSERYPEVEFLDLGTSGMAVLHALAGRRKAILLDCAFLGEPPGTLRRFTPDEVRSSKSVRGFTMHEGDLLQFLELARSLGDTPEEIVIFGIEPETVAPGMGLSETLEAKVGEYVEAVRGELA